VRVIAIEGCASLWKREVGRDFSKFGYLFHYDTVNKSDLIRMDPVNPVILNPRFKA
jgi:hypothetical protein